MDITWETVNLPALILDMTFFSFVPIFNINGDRVVIFIIFILIDPSNLGNLVTKKR